jgi:RHS repeat-associated protein
MTPLPVFSERPSVRLLRPLIPLVLLTFAWSAHAQVATPLSFSVSDNGAANASIPITVPPGIAGMVPKLALVYSSQQGNGPLGVGWGLAGIPVISRCPQTPAHTGATRAVQWDAADPYCLDGEYLVPVSEPGTTYTPGANGGHGTFYSTETEDFARIQSFTLGGLGGGAASFIVKTKEGATLEFGTTDATRIYALGVNAVRVWALARMMDASGNTIHFNYTKDDAGQYYINYISWGGNHLTGRSDTAAVHFGYEYRSDDTTEFLSGSMVKTTQRLKHVVTRADGVNILKYILAYNEGSPAPNALTGNSLLTSVVVSADNGKTLTPVKIEWARGTSNFSDRGSVISAYANFGSRSQGAYIRPMDVNADGKQDLVLGPVDSAGTWKWLESTGTGFVDRGTLVTTPFTVWVSMGGGVPLGGEPTQQYEKSGQADGASAASQVGESFGNQPDVSPEGTDLVAGGGGEEGGYYHYYRPTAESVRVVDFDGDLRQDLLVGPDAYGFIRWVQNTRNGMIDRGNVSSGRSAWANAQSRVNVVDFNGDGRSDIAMGPDSAGRWLLLESTGSNLVARPFGVTGYGNWHAAGDRIRIADMDGDGQQDYLLGPDNNGCWYWMQGQNTGYVNRGTLACGLYGSWDGASIRTRAVDLNADGRTDVLLGPDSGGNWYGLQSTGKTLKNMGTLITGAYGNWSGGGATRINATDLNGDGRTDVLIGPDASGYWYALRSTGTSLINLGANASGAYGAWGNNDAANRVRLMDMSGTGAGDIVVGPNSSGAWYVLHAPKVTEVVTRLDNASGLNPVTFDYGTLTDPAVYTPDSNAVYPLADLMVPMRVVSRLTTGLSAGPSGALAQNVTTFRYRGLKLGFGPNARGLLGFRSTEADQGAGGTRLVTEFRQDYPFLGLPKSKTKTTGTAWETTTYEYTCNNFVELPGPGCTVAPGRRYFVSSNIVVTEAQDLNGTRLPRTWTASTFDAFGNLSYTKTSTWGPFGESFSQEVYNTYINNTQRWWLGRLVHAQVKHTNERGEYTLRRSAFDYDSNTGLLNREIIEPNNSDLCLVTTYAHDAYGNRKSSTQRTCNGTPGGFAGPWANEAARPVSTEYAYIEPRTSLVNYDADPKFAGWSENAYGHRTHYSNSGAWGSVTWTQDPNGLASSTILDEFGRVSMTFSPDGTAVHSLIELCTRLGGPMNCPDTGNHYSAYVVVSTPYNSTTWAKIGPRTAVYMTANDLETRRISDGFDGNGTAPRNVVVDTIYDNEYRVIRKSEPAFDADTKYWTQQSYDVLGRVAVVTGADGSETRHGYNGLSTSVSLRESLSTYTYQTTTETKDALGRLVAVSNPLGEMMTHEYDPAGNLTRTTDQAGNEFIHSYDVRGRKRSTTDPDLGTVIFAFDVLGQQRWSSTNGVVNTSVYDSLGRETEHYDGDSFIHRAYERDNNGVPCGIGRLCYSKGGTVNKPVVERTFWYDAKGRIEQSRMLIAGNAYIQRNSYDSNGRLDVLTYPEGFAVRHSYTALGFLDEVKDVVNGEVFYKSMGANARGQVERFRQGNPIAAIFTRTSFDPKNGQVSQISADPFGQATIHTTGYKYDLLGNVTQIETKILGSTHVADYSYDKINRIAQEWSRGGSVPGAGRTTTFQYDAVGNIRYRSDVGTFNYPASGAGSRRPHAVTSVTGTVRGVVNPAYTYDDRGNMLTGMNRELTWYSFNMPRSIRKAGQTTEWTYDGDHERVREIGVTTGLSTTYFQPANGAGVFYEEVVQQTGYGPQRTGKYYINAGGLNVAIRTNANGVWKTEYLHSDRLGSVLAVTNESAAVTARFAYDPFGKRRHFGGASDDAGTLHASPDRPAVSRGFTNHVMLDDLGIIHMNGRVFDPALGRFMSADPLIQFPSNLQSYNRYSYGMNNPLSGTDPSGYSWLSKAWKKLWRSSVFRIILAITAAYLVGGWVAEWAKGAAWAKTSIGLTTAGNLAAGAAGGFAGGFVGSGGHLKDAIKGAFSGALFAQAGGFGSEGGWDRIGAHAAAGCVSGAVNGEGCGRGAFSAAVSKWATIHTDGIKSDLARGIAVTVVGGTISRLTGGKFGNGAVSAAYGYLFNHKLSRNALRKAMGEESSDSAEEFADSIKRVERSAVSNSTDNKFGINDDGFWKWWESNKKQLGHFDPSEEGYNPQKPNDMPNRDMAERWKADYDAQQAARARNYRAGKERGDSRPNFNEVMRKGRGGWRGGND